MCNLTPDLVSMWDMKPKEAMNGDITVAELTEELWGGVLNPGKMRRPGGRMSGSDTSIS